MKKNTLITLGLSVALGAGVIGAFASRGLKSFTSKAVECDHVGYHYDVKAATKTDAGWLEFWTCCKCHEHFDTLPSGSFEDASAIYSGSTPEEFVLPAGTKYYAKGAQIAADSEMDPQVQLSAIPATSAISFDFWIKENGSVGFTFCDCNNWANVLGNITFTKSDSGVSSTKGVVTAKTNNWYNVVIPRSEFNGDGLDRASNIGIVCGLWDGVNSCTAYSEIALACNWASFTVIENYVRYVPGNDVDTRLGYSITQAELTGKALSYNAYFGAAGNQTIKISLLDNGWSTRYICDLFLERVDGNYSLRQAGTGIPAKITELEDGWVNVTVNAKNLNFEHNTGDTVVVWQNPTTSQNGIDVNSFKAVDMVPEEISFTVGNFKTFGFAISATELVRYGAFEFNIKVTPGTTAKISFMASSWANFGTSYFTCNEDGELTVYYQNKTTSKGVVTQLEDGWFHIVFNEYELEGDGRSDASSQNATHIYCEQVGFIIDGASFKYCAPHAQTGMSYGAGAITRGSWDNERNFAYARAKVEFANAGVSFDFKPVGDGVISLTFMGNDWENISGGFNIAKSGDDVTSNYANARIIARADGWYSIYLPAPWTGDGYTKDTWTDLCLVYSGSGYSGTSFTINWNSIHMYHNGCMPA